MGSNIEKDIYDLTKNYAQVVFSKKRPPLDYELNEVQKINTGFRKQVTMGLAPDVPIGDGFLVESTGNPNEIKVRHGLLLHNGENLLLPVDIDINTLTTPGGSDRTDYVYIEWYPREVDSVEDPDLIDTVNIGIETAVRTKIQIDVFVVQGGTIPVPAPGRFQYRIATLNRLDGIAILDASQIVDDRITSGMNFVSTGGRIFQTGPYSYSFEGVTGLVGGNAFALPNSVGSVGPTEVKYLYVSDLESLLLTSTLPTSYHVPLARIETDGLSIVDIRDLRRFKPAIQGGGGGSQTIIEATTLDPTSAYQVMKVAGVNTVTLADASSVATIPVLGMSIDAGGIGDVIRIMTNGVVTNPAWSFTAGQTIYASTTSGELTATAPSGMSEVRQKLAIALSPTTLYFSPDLTYEVVGGISLHTQNTDAGTTGDSFVLRYGSGVAISSPAGFTVNRGVGLPVDLRYNPTGNKWQITDDGSLYYDLNAMKVLATSVGAASVGVDTTNFFTNLSAADNTVQKALETLDDLASSSGGEINKTYYYTLTATDITNGYFELPPGEEPSDPDNVRVNIIGGTIQRKGATANDDFDVVLSGAPIEMRRITWAGQRMAGNVFNGTEICVEYATGNTAPPVVFRYKVDLYTLTLTDITNKFVVLSQAPTNPTNTIVELKGGVPQWYADDYTVTGSTLDWSSLGLESLVVVGSIIRVIYEYTV